MSEGMARLSRMWLLVVQSAAQLLPEPIDKLLMRLSKKQKTRHEWRVFQIGKISWEISDYFFSAGGVASVAAAASSAAT
jgi:hypothetical protein